MAFVTSSGLTESETSKTVQAAGMTVHYHDIGTGAVHQLRQLVEVLPDHLVGQPGEHDADEDDPLPERALDERPGQQVAQDNSPGWMSTSATRTSWAIRLTRCISTRANTGL